MDAGFNAEGHLRGDDDLRSLHGDPRWRELVRSSRELAQSDGGDDESDGDESDED